MLVTYLVRRRVIAKPKKQFFLLLALAAAIFRYAIVVPTEFVI
jgi:hypothetical protein